MRAPHTTDMTIQRAQQQQRHSLILQQQQPQQELQIRARQQAALLGRSSRFVNAITILNISALLLPPLSMQQQQQRLATATCHNDSICVPLINCG